MPAVASPRNSIGMRARRCCAMRSASAPISCAFTLDSSQTLGGLGRLLTVEALAVGGHISQQLRYLELRPVLLRQGVALRNEPLHADLVDQADRPTGLRRETQPHDRAYVAVLRGRQHVRRQAARRVDRLHVEQTLLDLALLGALGRALAVEQLWLRREVLGQIRPQPL